MLHLVTAWKTPQRNKVAPVVLYCGEDRALAKAAIASADPEFQRIENAEVIFTFTVPRPKPAAAASQNSTAVAKPQPEAAAPRPTPPPASGGVGDGPELSPAPVAENLRVETRNQKPASKK